MKAISRRNFVKESIATTITLAVTPSLLSAADTLITGKISKTAEAALSFKQVPLLYAVNGLEPSIDAMTMEIHYGKHHAAYVKNVNAAIVEEKIPYTTEKDFFANASKLSSKAKNNGGGAWNHNFFWQVMTAKSSGTPYGALVEALDGSFGSVAKFKEQFTAAGMSRFGSGWVWLVKDGDKLKIGSTANQDNPLMDTSELKGTPLLALDVWEHAYYLKYQNKRNEYIENWWKVVNWDEVATRLKA